MALLPWKILPGFWIFSYKMEPFPSHSHKGYHRVRAWQLQWIMRTGVYQVSGTGSSVCCLLDSANVLHRLRRPSCVRLLWTTWRAVSGCSRGRHQLVTAALRCHGPSWGVALLLLLGHSGLNSTAVTINVLPMETTPRAWCLLIFFKGLSNSHKNDNQSNIGPSILLWRSFCLIPETFQG